MKTVGRILIILAVFAALSGLMVFAVNASGTSSSAPDFDGAPPQFEGQEDREGFSPEDGETRPERGERGERGGGGWMFGLTKNIVVIALLVILIALPKSISQKRKRAAVSSANGGA